MYQRWLRKEKKRIAGSLKPPPTPKNTASPVVAPAFFVVGGFAKGADDGPVLGLQGGQAIGTVALRASGLVHPGGVDNNLTAGGGTPGTGGDEGLEFLPQVVPVVLPLGGTGLVSPFQFRAEFSDLSL